MSSFGNQYGINLPAIYGAAMQARQFQDEQAGQSALAKYAPDVMDPNKRAAAVTGAIQANPKAGFALAQWASKLSDQEKADYAQKAQIGGQLAGAVLNENVPDAQLPDAVLTQIIPQAKQAGLVTDDVEQAALQAKQTGDAAQLRQLLQNKRDSSMSIAQQLSQSNADRTYQADRSDHADTVNYQNRSLSIQEQNANKPISVSPGSVLVNPRTGQQVGGTQPPGGGQPNLTGDAYLQTLPPAIAAQVKAVSEGRAPYPQGYAARTPLGQAVLNALPVFDPQFEAGNYTSRMKTRTDFMGGGKSAQNVKALNTAIGHAGRLFDQIGGTASGNFTPLNYVANQVADVTGSAGPQNFRQTASALASELTTVFRGSGGAEADVVRQLGSLSENSSREQKEAAVRNAIDLLNSRLQALHDQYTSGMGTMQTPYPFVSDKSKAILAKIGPEPTPGPGDAPSSSGWSIKKIP